VPRLGDGLSISDIEEDQPSLGDRLLTAVIAPIAFNLSIIILLAVFFRRSRFIGRILYNQLHAPFSILLIVLVAIPALIGLVIGMSRFITLLGHFFYTNLEHEKNLGITLFVWFCLLLTTYCVSLIP
jgi:hypothetical protein